HKWPIGIGLDAAAPGMILGQGIGRLGDLINGEHLADRTGLPWGVKYLHPDSPQYRYSLNNQDPNDPLRPLDTYAVHPVAGGYELLGDFIILGILLFVCRRFIRVPGWVFCSYIAMYGIMRFFLSYFRFDEQTIANVPVPQLTSGILLGIAVIAAGILYRKPGPITPEYAERVWGDLPLPGEEPESAAPSA
ncbi:MAG TPA: prolipoprotein diacylglyceryl transferase, partial [Tepidiformaceae bacterium]|nr:prolipoprotein diacylglyceryl transferase [Tepidiformaceae bacterium]